MTLTLTTSTFLPDELRRRKDDEENDEKTRVCHNSAFQLLYID
jgi:hypothetical protein